VAYAIQATLQLAQADRETPIPCSRLAADGGMPERFLLQILRNLVTQNILGSTRGVEGGYWLKRGMEEISLLDVIEAIDGPMNSALPTIEGLPHACKERLECVLTGIAQSARSDLKAITLADLVSAVDGHAYQRT
jgi:Rrf2 family protein